MKNLKYASLAIVLIAAASCSKNNTDTVTTTASATDSVVATPAVTDSLTAPATDSTAASANAQTTDYSGYKVAATQEFTGEGKDLKAEYLANDADKRAIKFTFEGKTYTLPQTEAWAKGAIYKDGDVQFEDKGQVNSAVLTVGAKKYNFNQKK